MSTPRQFRLRADDVEPSTNLREAAVEVASW